MKKLYKGTRTSNPLSEDNNSGVSEGKHRNGLKLKILTFFMSMILVSAAFSGCNSNQDNTRNESASLSDIQEDTSTEQIDSSDTQVTSHDVSVLYVNVGKADSILVQVDDKNYLIDTGTEEAVPELLGALKLQGVEELDGVFLTHTHSDHIGGLSGLTQKYDIPVVYSAEISMNKKDGTNKIDELVSSLDLQQTKLSAGDTVEITEGVSFEVIGPIEYNSEDDNDNSLVLRMSVNGKTFLFTGDMQFAEETSLIDSGVDLNADILKVGNHGNKDATSEDFVAAVTPDISVISTDTSVKADSANERVVEALSDSDIYITQDFSLGVLCTVEADGTVEITNPQREKLEVLIVLDSISKEDQIVTLSNRLDTVDISGYCIYSSKGDELFVFPEGSTLEKGQIITIGNEDSTDCDYVWNEKKIWSNKKEDIGYLYDCNGNLISTCISE